ncbi:kinesin-like protein KIF2C [Ambystoma mexicanum]|uniref:kinesin-like protein KIF2C n=1 Tax=Ambystoma mexicanum TaxID=8296 RepID=UPI0037E8CED7
MVQYMTGGLVWTTGMNPIERAQRHSQRRKEKPSRNARGLDDLEPKRMGVCKGLDASRSSSPPPDAFMLNDKELPAHVSSLQNTLARIGELEDERVEELRELVQEEMSLTDLMDTGEPPHPDLEKWVNQAEYLIQERSQVLAALGENMSSLRRALQLKKQASQ